MGPDDLSGQPRESWGVAGDQFGHLAGRGKSAAGGEPGAERDGDSTGPIAELSEEYWLDLWAFGTSPYGLGLTAETLWGLCDREFRALSRQWERAREYQMTLVAAMRADLFNTSAKGYDRTFEARDFLPGASSGVENRIAQLIAEGYTPSEAAAIATSKQTREHKLYVIDGAMRQAHQTKLKGCRRRMG